jgi:tRNA pseudouridine55 synthase
MGHGGTLDPFATGLLVVCVGRGVKLSRYFLGSVKSYEAVIRFGETTIPGDPTAEISERSTHLPSSLDELQSMADRLAAQPYLQTPPMYSAKKKDGVPLYELAREGLEIEREPKLCHLYRFKIESYTAPEARISVICSSGTYIRTLAQDFARLLGTVGMLMSLRRTRSGPFDVTSAMTVEQIAREIQAGVSWDALPCFVPFDKLLDGYARADATPDEATALLQGKQNVLFSILKRVNAPEAREPGATHDDAVAIYSSDRLLAVARLENGVWGIERVFPPRE